MPYRSAAEKIIKISVEAVSRLPLIGASETVATLAAIIIHELGHILASAILGCPLKRITLQLGGLRLSGARTFSSYGEEATVALAGPFMNIVCFLAFNGTVAPLAQHFALTSLALAVLNLMPAIGFDGYNAARCVISRFASPFVTQKICDALSFLAFFCIWCTAVYAVLKTGRHIGALIFSILMFLRMMPTCSSGKNL